MVIIWGFSFVVVDIAVEFMPPLSVAFYRFVIASLAFIIIDIYLKLFRKKNQIKNNNNKRSYSKKDWILLILASFTGVSFFFFAQYSAIEIIGPSLPALFVCLLSPVIIASIGGFHLITGGNLNRL